MVRSTANSTGMTLAQADYIRRLLDKNLSDDKTSFRSSQIVTESAMTRGSSESSDDTVSVVAATSSRITRSMVATAKREGRPNPLQATVLETCKNCNRQKEKKYQRGNEEYNLYTDNRAIVKEAELLLSEKDRSSRSGVSAWVVTAIVIVGAVFCVLNYRQQSERQQEGCAFEFFRSLLGDKCTFVGGK
ncbi:MAG: hypothetical protein FJZ63_04350 [Chlamydiae bacterium]|nr:hypothetical protein [Chlamydiota bacterium]